MRRSAGQGTIAIVLIIALMSAVVAATIAMSGGSLENQSAESLALTQTQIFENQLNAILSNSQICDQKLLINATTPCGSYLCGTFSVTGLPDPSVSPQVTVSSWLAQNDQLISTGPPIKRQADLSIAYKYFDPNLKINLNRTWKATVQYTPNGAHDTNCILASVIQGACTSMGFDWIATPGRCGICEDMGGTWSSSINECTF